MGLTLTSTGTSLLALCLLLTLPVAVFTDTCEKVKLHVPSVIYSGNLIGKVNPRHCLDSDSLIIQSSNPDFLVLENGSIYAQKRISLAGKTWFTIRILDSVTLTEKKIRVKLITKAKPAKSRYARELLRRSKRRWAPLPFSIMESYIGPFPCFVQQIQSDTQENYTIRYSISGPGVNEEPFDLFYVEPTTGNIYYRRMVDREQYPVFNLIGFANTLDGYSPEAPLNIVIKVEDSNDNAPIFVEEAFCIEVAEHTKQGVIIGRVKALDKDEPNTLHTTLRYSIISQTPPSPVMFALHPETGIITTTSNRLDRETIESYVLIIGVRDMPGQRSFLSSTGTVSITVTDVNDNPPTFVQKSYQVEVNENESGMVLLCIPITDNDIRDSPNWRAKYYITQGNEREYFSIGTNPETNEGCLKVEKGLNYEETKRIQILVGVTNEVDVINYSGVKSSGMSTIPVTIIVKDVDEGPEFIPTIKEIRVRENTPVGTEIYRCQAKDPETKNSDGIQFSEQLDTLNWVNIDATTCRITIARILDYETDQAPRHQHNVTIIGVDQSGKTGTGTLVIYLEDVNDNYPNISKADTTVCQSGRTYSLVVAEDRDGVPNSAPFVFQIDSTNIPNLQNQFKIERINDTAIYIRADGVPDGDYQIPLIITDQQGYGQTQIMNIRKCYCPDNENCVGNIRSSNNVALGGWAILVMVLAALLFALLLCGLCACLCGAAATKGKKSFPDDSAQQNLIVTNTEAPGADVMDSNFKVPVHVTDAHRSGNAPSVSGGKGQSGSQIIQQTIHTRKTTGQLNTAEDNRGGLTLTSMGGGGQQQFFDVNRVNYTDWHSFMNNHLDEKLYMCGQNEEQQHGDDYVLSYNFEGKGSAAGSVGCCSDFRDEDRMDFLNNLEPKFRTLAEVCAKK
ncbi:desmocollin 3 S homeolog precursor [Xenopus laevis]|uniref:Desmocollin 3 S homeolog precursor n=1 Tax=Xenopus laevis TaxID=8355 RepID=Q5HZ99_XENLA|nr:desmocollin 3 S homeolog precursor [Xenopus laevis]AAH89120.1 MGC85083 protein [Xenopus laevis]